MQNSHAQAPFTIAPTRTELTDAERKEALGDVRRVWLRALILLCIPAALGLLALGDLAIDFPGVLGLAVLLSIPWTLIRSLLALRAKRHRKREAADEAADALARRLQQLHASTQTLAAELPQCLSAAQRALRAADCEYRDSAFSPFWSQMELAAKHLVEYQAGRLTIEANRQHYEKALHGRTHTCPPFPCPAGSLPSGRDVAAEFRQVLRKGQTNFRFASIWEQRRTSRAITPGFQTSGETIEWVGSHMGENDDSDRGTPEQLSRFAHAGLPESLADGLLSTVSAQHGLRQAIARRSESLDDQQPRGVPFP